MEWDFREMLDASCAWIRRALGQADNETLPMLEAACLQGPGPAEPNLQSTG